MIYMSILDHKMSSFISDLEIISDIDDIKNRYLIQKGPLILELHPTNICNSNCYFCNQKLFRNDRKEFDLSIFRTLIDRLKINGLRRIRFSGGGEPLMHKEFQNIYKLVQEANIDIVALTTNGQLLNSVNINAFCSKPSLWTLHVSLQSPDKKTWSDITGCNSNKFDDIIRSLELFANKKEDKQNCVISFILCEQTLGEIHQMAALAKKCNAICHIHDLNSFVYSDSFLSKLESNVDYLKQLKEDLNLSYGFYNIPFIMHLTDCYPKWVERTSVSTICNNDVCLAPWASLLIRPNGSCYICCALAGQDHSIGNIHEDSIDIIWSSKVVKDMRLEAEKLFLSSCSYIKRKELNINYFSKPCFNFCPIQNKLYSNFHLAKKLREKYNN